MDSANKTEQTDDKEREMIFKGYLKEYEECCNSYRHIYTTIWASAVAFFALSSALMTVFASKYNDIYISLFVSIVPFLFWFYAIFLPMDSYGDTRKDRQREIEELLEEFIPKLKMEHARNFKKNKLSTISVTWSIKSIGCLMTICEVILFTILWGVIGGIHEENQYIIHHLDNLISIFWIFL